MNRWETQLRAEGLHALDHEWRGGIVVGNKGSGKLHFNEDSDPAFQAMTRETREATLDAAREVLRTHRFPVAKDRRIWALHADGVGTREIAAQLHHDRRTVRASIAATTFATHRRATRNVDPHREIRKEVATTATLVALLRAFG